MKVKKKIPSESQLNRSREKKVINNFHSTLILSLIEREREREREREEREREREREEEEEEREGERERERERF